MTIAINGIGLATAQGNTAEIIESRSFRASSKLPWTAGKSNISRQCYPATGIDSTLSGAARWRALAGRALAEVAGSDKTPLLMASCNGSAAQSWEKAFEAKALLAGTKWADDDLPVFSSSCASGIHALYAAHELLTSGAVKEVLVLAADVLALSNHENFESLRVLAEEPCTPWQSTSSGFILGEAAVVLKLAHVQDEASLTVVHGPELGSDLVEHDGLSSVIETLSPKSATMIFGQGTGPYATDAAELRALGSFVDRDVPIYTPLSNFGHTLGASSLLSIALAVALTSLAESSDSTTDARPICRANSPSPPRHELKNILATCSALNGACAATWVGRSHGKTQTRKAVWKRSVIPSPLMHPVLKRLACEAYEQRPIQPPDVLILRLEKPLAPPPSAVIGKRLLPSAVLEMTPGFASQLIARCWGYTGPALCLVGNVDPELYGLTNAFLEARQSVYQVNLRGSGDNRAIEWNI